MVDVISFFISLIFLLIEDVLNIIPQSLLLSFLSELNLFLSFWHCILFEIPKNFGLLTITQYFDGKATKSETFGAFLGS